MSDMKQYTSIILSVFAALTLFSCAKETIQENPADEAGALSQSALAGQPVSFSASIPHGGQSSTRTVYGNVVDGIQLIKWKNGDRITIAQEVNTNQFTLDYGIDPIIVDGGHNEAETSRTEAMIFPYGEDLLWEEGRNDFYAVYPSDAVLDNNVATMEIPSAQVQDADDKMEYAYMYAAASSEPVEHLSLQFKPMFTAFEFALFAERESVIKKITLTSDKQMCGSYTATITSSEQTASSSVSYAFESNAERYKTISAVFPNNQHLNIYDNRVASPMFVNVTLFALPQDYDNLSATIETSDGEFVLDLTGNGYVFRKENKYRIQYIVPMKTYPDHVIKGAFSVSSDKQVYFSPSPAYVYTNGSHTPATNNWFMVTTESSSYSQLGSSMNPLSTDIGVGNGYVKLFGWSTPATERGLSSSVDDSDYNGVFVDWSTDNTIHMNTYNASATFPEDDWRTLSAEELSYLLGLGSAKRNGPTVNGVENARFAKAKVGDHYGLLVFPDDYVSPMHYVGKSTSGDYHYYAMPEIKNINDPAASYADNELSSSLFQYHQNNGCVFITSLGIREGNDTSDADNVAAYWTSTPDGDGNAFGLYVTSATVEVKSQPRHLGQGVRLVRDVE